MFINGTQFNCEIAEIIEEMKEQLMLNGINLFSKAFDSGDNYMVCCPYHKNGQEKRPSAGIRKSDGMFHCFRADTEVITNYGVKPIRELVGKVSTVLNGNGNWEQVVFSKYGDCALYKLTLTQDNSEKIIYTTKDHEWFVHKYLKLYTTENLKQGMYLDGVICNASSFTLDIDGLIHGIIYGDGTRNIRYSVPQINGHRCIDKSVPLGVSYRLNIPKFTKKSKLVEYFNNLENWSISTLVLSNKEYWSINSKQLPLEHNYKRVPELWRSRNYLMSFLAGCFACDGSYALMSIYSSKLSDLRQIQDICIACGVSVRTVKESIRDTNYSKSVIGSTLFIYPKSLPDEFFLLDTPKSTKYSRFRWKVKSVEPTNIYEPVYCCETSTHSFVLADNILTHNCLACGETHGLDEMIANCFGYADPSWGYRWLVQNFNTVSVEERKDIELDLSRDNTKSSYTQFYVPEEELDTYRYIHPYMYQRGLSNAVIEGFDIGYDKVTDTITFPVRDLQGRCLFIARRNVKYKRFDLPKDIDKPLYGMYEVYKNIQLGADTSEIYVCEGLFDCLKLWSNGKPAVAGFGCLFNKKQIQQLRDLPIRKLILALDNDKAGRDATERLKKEIKNKIITEVILPNGRKDIGECSEKEISELQEVF